LDAVLDRKSGGDINVTELSKDLQQQKARILEIAHQYHANNIRVFGSVVRGEERGDSDIDLLVDFMPGTTLLDQVGLIDALSTALGRKVDVVSERALNKYLRQRVLQEAVPL
jgi:predicted nucleotidyltransferase